MKNMDKIITVVKNYLQVIGINEVILENELKNVEQILVLNLPECCIVKENRPFSSGKQVHIHVTGQGMKFFFDGQTLMYKPSELANDVKEDIILFSKNLINLRNIGNEVHHVNRNIDVNQDNEIIESYTYKKVGRIGTPGIQVQISKKRLDDVNFLNLRRCLFTNDALIFIKTSQRKQTIVVGIPNEIFRGTGLNYGTIFEKVEKLDNANTEYEKNLRKVNYNNIANFSPNDEEDTKNNVVDLTSGIETRKKRTERHQDIVKLIALDLERAGYTLFENPVDCLAIMDDHKALLFEVKTLDGTPSDEKKQVQKSFAQLFYYEEFYVKEITSNEIQKIVVFESRVSDKHIEFFENLGIQVLWVSDNNHLINDTGIIRF